jgi:hypothetical protein
MFKDRVAAVIATGTGAGAAATRYRRLAERHPVRHLDAAIALLGRMRAAEIEARNAAIRTWGHAGRPRAALMLLDELCLILRMVRRHAPSRYQYLLAEVLGVEAASGFRRNGAAATSSARKGALDAEETIAF